MTSLSEWERAAAESQRRSDARRIARIQRDDEQPWRWGLFGLALLAGGFMVGIGAYVMEVIL